MATQLVEILNTQANRCFNEAQAITERADETGALSGEDQATFDRLVEEGTALRDQMTALQETQRAADTGDRSEALKQEVVGRSQTGELAINYDEDGDNVVRDMGRRVMKGLPSGVFHIRPWVVRDWNNLLASGNTPEITRALAKGTDNLGGVTVPTIVESRFYEVLLRIDGVRMAGADVWNTSSGETIRLPKAVDIAPGKLTSASIIGEAAEITEAGPTFSSVDTSPVKVGGMTYVSRELLQDSVTNIEAKVAEMLARQVGWKTEFLYNLGTGTGQPKGIFHSPPAAQVVTTATKGALTYDEIVATKYKIGNYPQVGSRGPVWTMDKATFGHILRIKDNDGRPLFVLNTKADQSPMILGDPVVKNQYAGVVDTANAYIIGYGDFGGAYIIRDVGTVELRVSTEHRFAYDQMAYRCLFRTDGQIINSQLLSYIREKSS